MLADYDLQPLNKENATGLALENKTVALLLLRFQIHWPNALGAILHHQQ
jgi:hypothetical protein